QPSPSAAPTQVAKTATAPMAAAATAHTAPAVQDTRPIKLDPFFEVRTPERNFGPARLPGGVTVTPLARRLAAESGIDLSRLRGSGPHGRIVAHDVATAPRPARVPLAAQAAGPRAPQGTRGEGRGSERR